MRTVILSDVCAISSGGTPSRAKSEYFNGNIPWAKISDIENAKNNTIYKTEEYISIDGLKNIRDKMFSKGTLLFAIYGSIGKTAFAGIDLSTNQAILGIRAIRDDEIDLVYLNNWFKANKEKLIGQGKGVALKNLSATFIRNLHIPLPPLEDQKRIASILTRVEKLIAQRKESIQLLDELLKSTFLEMFGITTGNYQKNRIDVLSKHTKIVSGVTKGKKYNDDNLIEAPYMRVANVQDGHFNLDEIKTIHVSRAEYERYLLKSGDVLLTEGGDPDKLGRGSVWEEQIPDCIHQNHIFRVRINDFQELNPYYLSGLVASIYGKSYFLKSAKQTTGIASINSTQLKNFPIIIPPIRIQNKFAAIVEKIESIKSRYQQSLTELENLYDSLSQKAFKGELNLSLIPLPEEDAIDAKRQPYMSDEDLKLAARKALSDLNLFNQNKEALSAFTEAIGSIDLNSSALRIAREMAEQATLWKTPMDELKNISSIARSLAEISKPSSALQKIVAEQTASIQHTAKIAEEIGKSIPQINFSFVAQQRDLIESAMKPFTQMQQNIANLTAPLKGLQDTIGVFNQYEGVLPPSVSEIIDNELEPKHIFTSFDILDILSDRNQLSFPEILEMLSELEAIDIAGYERIKKLLYELLQNGIVQQTFNEEKKVILLSVKR